MQTANRDSPPWSRKSTSPVSIVRKSAERCRRNGGESGTATRDLAVLPRDHAAAPPDLAAVTRDQAVFMRDLGVVARDFGEVTRDHAAFGP
jgi:hypothetical protein